MGEEKMKKEVISRAFLSFFFLTAIIVLSKIKLHPIFGTSGKFSLVGPFIAIIPYFLGITIGGIVIFSARIIQFIIGISHAKNVISYLAFLPAYFAGIQFKKIFKGDRRVIIIPLIAILLFILHPIGRMVWYYSLFWLIPIIITLSQPKLRKLSKRWDIPTKYLYSLSATYIDHAIGSIIFLYAFNIPAVYWNMAIPYVPIERAIFALIILGFYLFVKHALDALSRVVPIYIIEREIVPVEKEVIEAEVVAKN